MYLFFLKGVAIWVLLLVVAILNAAVRDKLLAPLLGQEIALPLSGILLSILVFLITLALIPLLGTGTTASIHYWLVGLMWLLLTIVFDFTFGHYFMRKRWSQLIEIYSVSTGNLWVLVLLVTTISPYVAAKCRGPI